MEDLKEKAAKYAAEASNQLIQEAIAKAYTDGYRDGYNDHKNELTVRLYSSEPEYIDLGLPSGILWAKKYGNVDNDRQYVPYEIASKMSIPNLEQVEELKKKCLWTSEDNLIKCIGPNGNCIFFAPTGYQEADDASPIKGNGVACFWIKYDDEKDIAKKAAYFINNEDVSCSIADFLAEFKLPIRLIKI